MNQDSVDVSIRGLTRRYQDSIALDSVDLDIASGEVIAVLGASGCGKSTLLRLLAGLDTPSEGTIAIGGHQVNGPGFHIPPERRPVNMVFQDFALWPHMNVRKIIEFGMRHRHIPRAEWSARLRELLDLLELRGLEDRLPRQLSGGQQQRVAIARALATRPRLLLLDEPLSNLDSQLRLQMRDELAALLRRIGTTALYVTHDLHEAMTLGHRLVVMRDGRIEQSGTSGEIFRNPGSPWVAGLVGFSNRIPVVVEDVNGGRVRVRSGSHLLEASSGEALKVGDEALLLAQPQALTLTTGDGANRLRARVQSCHFEGTGWRLRCQSEAAPLTVHTENPFDEGKVVTIEVPADSARAYSRTAA
ncbi:MULTISPECIES: ABC transporter ATP-binding protein [unclassified Thioalkalivibrio]|uniref:ABC transporter ATP-binding protein n=1 Tax=unclassified Thioalkalivibrio TaxID=2621013 RepID=UPI000360050D|nr:MULTISPECIES: ABC transporter ATP-binding protein [unclassified Thioalkalivibrio]